MRSLKLAAAVVLAVSMSGCAVQKELVPTGGSRSDGTVRMSFEIGLFETPKIDREKTIATAGARCKAWGYDRAEPFGGATRECNSMMSGDCMQWLVSVEFQCIKNEPAPVWAGNPPAVEPAAPAAGNMLDTARLGPVEASPAAIGNGPRD